MSANPSSATKVPVEERLFSLVLALVATESGLTKAEILSTVQGYRQRFDDGGDNASLERQFERDKDDIRELGVPLETVDAPGEPGNNQHVRYRIPKGEYDLPPEVTFSPAELTLLSLAATVWREGSLSGESRRAVLKLGSLGVDSDAPILGYAPRIQVRDAAFAPLRDALERRQIVSFGYLKPGEASARTRTIAPLALVQHQGRWHLHAVDQDVAATRTFLLSRIVGTVTVTKQTFEQEGENFASRALAELEQIWDQNIAEVEVAPGSDAATRLNNRSGGSSPDNPRVSLHFSDLNILADELAGYGPEVKVVSPPRLIVAVRERLLGTLAAHEDGENGVSGQMGTPAEEGDR